MFPQEIFGEIFLFSTTLHYFWT